MPRLAARERITMASEEGVMERTARERFVEAMQRISKFLRGQDQEFGGSLGEEVARECIEAFADAECGLRERGGLWTVDWMKQHKGEGHAACRAALLKEVFGE